MVNPIHLVEKFDKLTKALKSLTQRECDLKNIANIAAGALQSGGKIITAGNGGSGCDALHFTGELVGKLSYDRPPLAAVCLNSDVSNMTCISNDYGYDVVFQRQLMALATKDDIFIAFSTSGNSKNIINALQYTKSNNIKSILFTGSHSSEGKEYAHVAFEIDSNETAIIQEVQTFITHYVIDHVQSKVGNFQ